MQNLNLKSRVLVAGLLLLVGACARESAQPSAIPISESEPPASTSPASDKEASPAIEPAEWDGDCSEISIHCGATPGAHFDSQGRLWAVFEHEGILYVTSIEEPGATFRTAAPVYDAPERVETNGENRPKIAFGSDGQIYVAWTRKIEGRFNGEIRFSRSLDDGRNFEPPRTINDDGAQIGHRFDSLHVDSAGHVYLAWIDKRDREAARSRGENFRGASVYTTVSTDGGASFAPNRRVAEHACECCRIAMTSGSGGDPGAGAAILWRHIFDTNTRDHAFAILTAAGVTGPVQRPSDDGWAIDACPHHGPAMVPAGRGAYHLAWFTAAEDRPVVYYGRFNAATGELHNRTELASRVPAAHPHILAHQGRLLTVWKNVEGEQTRILLRISENDGVTWAEAVIAATTQGASDHPFLVGQGDHSYLSWHTANEGWRLISL